MGPDTLADGQLMYTLLKEGPIEVSCVLPYEVDTDSACEFLLAAEEYAIIGGETIPYLLSLCETGEAMLWSVNVNEEMQALMITDEPIYRHGPALRVRILAGEKMEAWLGVLQDALREWALRIGAIHVELFGRPGWERVFGKYGKYLPKSKSMHFIFDLPA